MYLVTRDTHIALPPDAKNLINEVNFAITRSGLEGQLLGVTIQHEKPELEEQKSKLLHQEEEYKMQLSVRNCPALGGHSVDRGRAGMHWQGGAPPPPPLSRAPACGPAACFLTATARLHGISNRQ